MNSTYLKNRLVELDCFVDNKYLDLYVSLVIENQNTIKIAHKTNAHHIIPRAYFKLKNLPVDDSENNMCELLYIDHIRAHYYLLKCACREFKSRCYLAFQFIYGKYFSQDIEKLTEFDWEYIQKCHEEQRLLDSLSKKGVPKSEDVKQKIGAAKKGKCFGGNNNKAHRVLMFSKDDEYIRTFNTIKEAEEFIGAVGVGAVIKGRQKTCGGYIWKDGKN